MILAKDASDLPRRGNADRTGRYRPRVDAVVFLRDGQNVGVVLMNKRILGVFSAVVFMALALATPSKALIVNVTDSADSHILGETFTVDLSFSDLGDMTAQSLASYDIVVVFDSTILGLNAVTFGSALGGSGIFTLGTDFVQLTETSSLADTVLDSTQPAAFVVATMTFQAVNIGIGREPIFNGTGSATLTDGTKVNFTAKKLASCPTIVSDGGKKLPFPTTCTQVVAVPEPASFFLLLTGLVGLLVMYRSPLARRAGIALRTRVSPFAARRA